MDVTIRDLSLTFGERTLWDGLNHSFKVGTLTGITGPSGSGKSTLLNCLGGLERASSGTVSYGEHVVTGISGKKWRRLREHTLGFVFQDYALVSDASIQENLQLACRTRLLSRKASPEKLSAALGQVGLRHALRTRVSTLSGGEQQRLALARLLLKPRRIILADEPTAALDAQNTQQIIDLLAAQARSGAAVIIATHDAQVVDRCDSLLQLA